MLYIYIYIYREREREREREMGSGVTLKSYIFFKPLDLSRSNGKKKTFINANILISISLIIPCLIHSISIFKPKNTQKICISLIFFPTV